MQQHNLRLAYTVGLNIELQMGVLIQNNPDDVMNFVRNRYIESRNGTLSNVHHLQDKRHTVALIAKINETSVHVHIDYVFGEFLIDGFPMGRLPERMMRLATFQRIFGNTTFEVQPRNGTFSTVLPYKDFFYIFREHTEDGVIILEQNSNDHSIKQLIPNSVLKNIVPHLLVENFSHWYNQDNKTIEFRPKMFSDTNFVSVDGIQYVLDLTACRLQHVKSEKFLLAMRSTSYEKIVKLLDRLEHPDYINVVMDSPLKARVELIRMNLNFIIDCTSKKSGYDIESNEWTGMRVALKQNIGTLFGLNFGLVLESMDESMQNRILIVPHGKFNIRSMSEAIDSQTKRYSHVSVTIDRTKDAVLRTPSFFMYTVNNECRTLKANSYAAWFYLAHLHAVTSYPLPDPFTGTYIRKF